METWETSFGDYINKEYENYESGDLEELMIDLEIDFLSSLLRDYFNSLQKEYVYLNTEEAIIETIESNNYDFTDDGKIFN